MREIRHRFKIKADAATVFDAITTSRGLSRWLAPKIEATPERDTAIKMLFHYPETIQLKIIELAPEDLILWEVEEGPENWIGTRISFCIAVEEKEVVVDMIHSMWPYECHEMAEANFYWGMHLLHLKEYCERLKRTAGNGASYPASLSR